MWVRHGWAEQDKVVSSDARAAGNTSPMLFGFLPREAHEDFRQNLASRIAAQETIDHFGPQTLAEGIQACNATTTRLEIAGQGVKECVQKVLAVAKVYMGGGTEANGAQLIDKVKDAADSVIQRLFSQFQDADHANWSQVLTGARGGNVGALHHAGYQGEVVRHPVCKAIYELIGAGKKGREVRESFKAAPYGWPQDAIDAALVILTLAGNLRVTINGQPAAASALTQTQISNASFHVDVPPLTVVQRLELKALFQKLGITTQNGQESAATAMFLTRLLDLAQSAGGDPPLPGRPPENSLCALQNESGNAQLLKIHQQKDALIGNTETWTKLRDGIAKRQPVWLRLKELQQLASGLAVAEEVAISLANDYGAFMLRNALALALALGKEDGDLGF